MVDLDGVVHDEVDRHQRFHHLGILA